MTAKISNTGTAKRRDAKQHRKIYARKTHLICAINAPVKYWGMIADGLPNHGWSVGWFRFVRKPNGFSVWSADATKGDGKRIAIETEDLTIAFLELESQCRRVPALFEPDEITSAAD